MAVEKSICHYLLKAKTRKPELVAVHRPTPKGWETYNWREYYTMIERLAYGLKKLGMAPGTPVGILSGTRMEWAIADMAILGFKGITIPIYQSNKADYA